jgi:hypothetical protein
MANLVWRVKLVTELKAGETTEVEVERIERRSSQVGTLLRKWLKIYVICEKFLFKWYEGYWLPISGFAFPSKTLKVYLRFTQVGLTK